MRKLYLIVFFLFIEMQVFGQLSPTFSATSSLPNTENIYKIKEDFLYHVLHNPTEKREQVVGKEEHDNDLARFNRWFNFVQPRCYPTGDMPRPDILINEVQKVSAANAARSSGKGAKKTSGTGWQQVGPSQVPLHNNGIGRINCIVIDPLDTNTLYVGAACGGVHISHDGGATWTSNTDNFPSLSIADIAVNPIHTDTLYAATGDGYGYTDDSYNTFWGGLYSAGVMKSTDGGNTWNTTGLSFIQSNRDVITRLLISPANPNVLIAASSNGIYQTTNAGTTWTHVYTGNPVYSIAFKPGSPDTIYGVNNTSLIASYNGGSTWSILHAGINPVADRGTIAVTPAAPNAIWVLNANDSLLVSHDRGATFAFTGLSPADSAYFYGYYDRVLAVSPTDSQYIAACGMIMTYSPDGGTSWTRLDPPEDVHVDNHAIAINPLHTATMYSGNDGGISVTRNGGGSWQDLSNGLVVSQVYRMSSSQQTPSRIIAGLQDNGSIVYNDTAWNCVLVNDGVACAINPNYDTLQICSNTFGSFYMSHDRGFSFNYIPVSTETGNWIAPVVFDPNNAQNIYFGIQHIYATHDQGATFVELDTAAYFPNGALSLVIGASNSQVLYTSDQATVYRTTDGGNSWTNVTGALPTSAVAITHMAVDPRDPMRVYVTCSGYSVGKKVYLSTVGGTTWTNISLDLPNLPADCIAIDTSTPGALFVGTDIGVYYTDSSITGWVPYDVGLPNVIVDDIHINYGNYKVRAATYGRGIWEDDLGKTPPALKVPQTQAQVTGLSIYPNPTVSAWKLRFNPQKPDNFSVRVTDASGRVVCAQSNADVINASSLTSGLYNIEVALGDKDYNIKAIKK
jgi:photosystem II stability/assembly factor-like uncharacterized protein